MRNDSGLGGGRGQGGLESKSEDIPHVRDAFFNAKLYFFLCCLTAWLVSSSTLSKSCLVKARIRAGL